MKAYTTDKIRNLALAGHSGAGKTTLTEALLYKTGVLTRMGRVEDGNTVSDFDKEEIARGVSIGISILPVEWQDVKVNFIDTPGYFDFSGEVYSALRAAEAALVVIDAVNGIEGESPSLYQEHRAPPDHLPEQDGKGECLLPWGGGGPPEPLWQDHHPLYPASG